MSNVIEMPSHKDVIVEEGVYTDMPFTQYNELKAVRSHDLTSIIKDPYTWKYEDKPDSEASFFVEGRLQHCLFLEPHVFHDEFVVAPKTDRRTKVGKAEYEDFIATVGDRSIVTQDLYDACQKRVEVLAAFKPRKEDKTELSVVFDYYGHLCKARFDMLQNNVIIDLKTCRDASPKGFKQAVRSFGYHQQAAFYIDAALSAGLPEVDRFQFLAIQKQQPYPYAIYEMSDEALEYGRAMNEKALDMLVRCQKTGIYTPFNLHNSIVEIKLSDL